MALIGCWPFHKRWSASRQKKPKFCRLAVVGDAGSGKTSLIFRFSRGRMPLLGEQLCSVLETDEMDVIRNERMIRVVVHDTSGEEDYAKVRALSYNQADCVLVCLPIDSPQVLQRLQSEWAPEVRLLSKGKPFVLVGTKSDRRDCWRSGSSFQELNYISKKQGKKLAKKIGAAAYLECSALAGDGNDIRRVFGRAIREGLKRR